MSCQSLRILSGVSGAFPFYTQDLLQVQVQIKEHNCNQRVIYINTSEFFYTQAVQGCIVFCLTPPPGGKKYGKITGWGKKYTEHICLTVL